ncbi:hypothetical protein Rsub_09752 [Raphidocelis subcapitata]|uniref:Uncharacterized protein n=1 Tax=Raphidocelis subcapitata TaxID=307507 RepID=A0A2V0PCW9_9CHLO|nr:hypothetical protein Rsub_09752 [Raphidocelis subcapitata]|eukprot:GBF97694.1 hypothetical protein Rsub_09752 [Raphidocelis subcapitata]
MATDAEKLGKTVVLDYGSDTLKAGRARDVPSERGLSCATPAAVEARDPARADDAAGPGGAPWPRREAVRGGRIVDFDAFESLLHHVLYDRMGWRPGREDCLVVVEPVLAGRAERERLAQLAFETFGVRGYFVADAAACSLFACNKQFGVVADVGAGKALVASVADGVTHVAGAARLPWAGGADLDAHLRALLAGGAGGAAAAAAAGALGDAQLRAAKEQAACCAAGEGDYAALAAGAGPRAAAAEAAAAAAAADKQQQQNPAAHAEEWRRLRGAYTLPDGSTLQLGHAGYALGEALVRPASAGLAAPALAEVCCEVVAQQMEPAARRAVWDSVLLCGAAGCMPGLRERLLAELPLFGPPSASFGAAPLPHYLPTDARAHAAWMGGAVLARVVMHQMLTANEYDEWGPAVVSRVC